MKRMIPINTARKDLAAVIRANYYKMGFRDFTRNMGGRKVSPSPAYWK